MIAFAIDPDALRAPVNATTSRPARHEDLMADLAKRQHSLCRVKIPAASVHLALGELSQLLVDGQKVVPINAPALGFKFRFERLNRALDDLISKNTRQRPLEDDSVNTILRRQHGPD